MPSPRLALPWCGTPTRQRRCSPISPAATPRSCPSTPSRSAWQAREELAGNDNPLHLIGALVDLGDLGVAHHPLDRIVPGVAVAAEQLDSIRRDLHGHIGRKALGGRAEEGQV